MGSRRTVGLDLQPVRGDFAGQRFGVRKSPRPCARQSDIDRINSQRFHQMKDFDLFFDAGVEDRRILQTVAQGFVIQEDARSWRDLWRRGDVPVVDPFILRHGGPRLLPKQKL